MNYFRTRICIIEDNVAVKDGFAMILNSINSYYVVNTYTNCEDAIKRLKADSPDIILMDLELPGMSGIKGTMEIKKILPKVDIIINTIYEGSDMVFEALCAGASGYITKNSNYTELLDSIEQVVKGGAPMSTNIAKMVVRSFQKNPYSPLSKRETEVLEHIAKGKSYSVIAKELFITKETVKSHFKNIYLKLQVNTKAEAIAKAKNEKYI
jgi:DNA-binding NarL/FixJ family response regulator